MRLVCLSFSLLVFSACAGRQLLVPNGGFRHDLGRDHRLVGQIWSRERAELVSSSTLLDAVRAAPVLLLGETHDNRDQHLLEAKLLHAWLHAHPHAAVAFEMLDETQAAELTPPLPEDPDALASRVDWAHSGWPSFDLYRPVFALLLSNGAGIVAAHPSREHLIAYMQGRAPELARGLELERPLPAVEQQELVEEIRESHCGHAPASMITPMVRAQSFKDAWMARVLLDTGAPVALVAGRGHVRTDRAVPLFLGRHAMLPSLTVAFMDVDDTRKEPTDYEVSAYDYVVFTPRVTDESACDRFREQLEQMKSQRAPHTKDSAGSGDTGPRP